MNNNDELNPQTPSEEENKEEIHTEETPVEEKTIEEETKPAEEPAPEEKPEEEKPTEENGLDIDPALAEKIKGEEKPEENKPADDVAGDYNGKKDTNLNAVYTPISYFNDGTISIDDDIEKQRQLLNKKISKSKITDKISMLVMAVAFLGVIAVTFFNKNSDLAWLTWLVLGIAVAIIIASFLLATYFNKKTQAATSDYLHTMEDMTNGYVISNLNVKDASMCVEAKVDDEKVIEAHYFSVINSIQSRAIVEGKRNDKNFSIAEIAVVIPPISYEDANKKPKDYLNLDGSAYVPTAENTEATGTQELRQSDVTLVDMDLTSQAMDNNSSEKKKQDSNRKKKEPTDNQMGIFGKYFTYDMAVSSEESMIISYMGEKRYTILPTYLTGFRPVKVPGVRDNIVIFVANPRLAAKFFDEEGVKLINDITPSVVVQSAFLSINSHGSKLSLTLSDDIMSLPVTKMNPIGSFDAYRSVVEKAFRFIDHVDEKKLNHENH